MKKKPNPTLILIAITELILVGFLTGSIQVTTYNDGGFVYRVSVFQGEFTLIDEPAAIRRLAEGEPQP